MRQAVFVLRDICRGEFAPGPAAWRVRKSAADWFACSKAASAPGVATIRPSGNSAIMGMALFFGLGSEQNVQASILNDVQQELRGRKQNAIVIAGSIRSSCEAARSGRD